MPRLPLGRVEPLEVRRLFTVAPVLGVELASIAGTVHLDDVVADQHWQPGETGVAGVVVELLDHDQKVIATTQTDAEGHYQFDDLWPGEYAVREVEGGVIFGIDAVSGVQAEGNDFSERLPFAAVLPPTAPGTPSVPTSLPPAIAFTATQLPPTAPTLAQPAIRNEYVPNSVDDDGYGWRLTILDLPTSSTTAEDSSRKLLHVASFKNTRLRSGQWSLGEASSADFGLEEATPLAGDFNGDGQAELALFHAGEWHIDINANGQWDENDLWLQLGGPNDRPVVGDWNGDGHDDIGVFGPRTNTASNQTPAAAKSTPEKIDPDALSEVVTGEDRVVTLDHVFELGVGSDQPIAGDFDGDGRDEIGIFRNGLWLIDRDGDRKLTSLDQTARFGEAGDRPVIGDFDGDGRDEIGVFRNGKWIVDTNHNGKLDAADQVFEQGTAGDFPIVGDFNGDGTDEPGFYRAGPAARVSRTP